MSSEAVWITRLRSQQYGQPHIADALEKETSETDKANLLQQLENVDASYPGGVIEYLDKARVLLKESLEGVNAFEGCVPELPDISTNFKVGSDEHLRVEEIGMGEIPYSAFVLVAGGLGERLGYSGIKIGLPVDTVTNRTYIQLYIESIIEYERIAKVKRGDGVRVPLVIMTSDDTHDKTLELLETKGYYGLEKAQVTLLKQEKVPALEDNDARISISHSPLRINTKPHGHGDVHTLLAKSGLLTKWMGEGLRWVCLFQDTNGLIFNSWPMAIGSSSEHNLFMNFVTISRRPGEQTGAICKLVKGSTSTTGNVEYNQLEPMLRSHGGEQANSEGYSSFPGNLNVLVMSLPRYSEVLTTTGGGVPEFINPKYKDDTKTSFKSPTRVECLMQDISRSAGPNDKVGATQTERWFVFSPVKNDVLSAAAKVKSGVHPECALSGEADLFECCLKRLSLAAQLAGCKVESPKAVDVTYGGVTYPMGAKVVLLPSFGMSMKECAKRVIKGSTISVSLRSCLVLGGEVTINGLSLDGYLDAEAKAEEAGRIEIENLNEVNKGVVYENVDVNDAAVGEEIRMRGFKVVAVDKKVLTGQPGA